MKDKKTDIGKWLQHVFGLSYLDPADVDDCVAEVFVADCDADSRVVSFLDYLVDTYINEGSVFPAEIWADCTSSTERTTNTCESFHAHFNKLFYIAHPNIFNFVEQLKDVQVETYIKINSTNCIRKTELKILNQIKVIDEKIELYRNNRLSRYEYVKSLSYFSKRH